MKRPSKVKVGPHTYEIKYTKQAWKEYGVHKVEGMVGLCIAAHTTILVKAWSLSPSQIKDTVIHELMHAMMGLIVFDNQPFGIPDNLHDIEEMIILMMSPHWLQLMQDNPELVKWLSEVK